MAKFLKFIYLSCCFSFLGIIHSCVPPESTYSIDFTINSIRIDNIDNAGEMMSYSTSNTMKNNAVAFEISLYSNDFLTKKKNNISRLFITEAIALSPILPYYKLKYDITNIKIITMENISETKPALTDVTNMFLAFPEVPSTSDFLYISIDDLYDNINNKLLTEQNIRFVLVCKEIIQQNNARFKISVTFSNNEMLEAETELIDLIE